MSQFLKLMKIFEVLWLIVAIISLCMAIVRASNGQQFGSYIYITLFTGAVAFFMYRFKKKNRKYLEGYYKKKAEEEQEMLKNQVKESGDKQPGR